MSGQSPTSDAMAVARDWHVRRLDGLSPAEAVELDAWLSASDAHRQAMAQLEGLWADLAWDETLNAQALDRQAARDGALATRSRKAWWRLQQGLSGRLAWLSGGGAVLAACLALAVIVGLPGEYAGAPGLAGHSNVYETAVGEIRKVTLADGSEVTLGGRTTIRVDMGRRERMVRIVAGGDALFDVARDEERPFTVRAGSVSARVLGTVFEINRSPGSTAVSVVEGQVQVTGLAGEDAVLGVGDRIVAVAGEDWTRERFDPGQAARWIETRLAYRDVPLSDIVEDINRYHEGGLALASPELGALRVTSSFRIDQMETALSGIALSHGLELAHTPSGGYLLRRPDGRE